MTLFVTDGRTEELGILGGGCGNTSKRQKKRLLSPQQLISKHHQTSSSNDTLSKEGVKSTKRQTEMANQLSAEADCAQLQSCHKK